MKKNELEFSDVYNEFYERIHRYLERMVGKDDGQVACVGNGNPISHESYQAKQCKTFHGLCLAVVRSTKQGGDIRLTANSKGLVSERILLQTKGH